MNTLSPSLHTPLRRQLTQYMRQCSPLQQPHRFISTSLSLRAAGNPARHTSRTAHEKNARYKKSIALSAAGMVVSAIAMYGTVHYYFPTGKDIASLKNGINVNQQEQAGQQNGAIKLDGPGGLGIEPSSTVFIDGVEQVPTGNGTVPNFPKTIELPRSLESTATRSAAVEKIGDEINNNGKVEEYRLLGLGIRSVSFLSIQVYVVGLYIATSDLPALQRRLVRKGATPVTAGVVPDDMIAASSLVPGEREELKNLLLDPEKGEAAWADILKEGGIKTALRIVPTRNTDFLHLRDGWVRSITGRAQKANAQIKELAKKSGDNDAASAPQSEYTNDSFGVAVNDFKSLLGGGSRKNVPKGQTLLLLRDRQGALEILYQATNGRPWTWLGAVEDERISRLLWMGYLSGKNVASDGARKDIVDGMMDIAGRPIGTVEQKVA